MTQDRLGEYARSGRALLAVYLAGGCIVGLTEERITVEPGVDPEPGSEAELRRFARLQERLGPLYRKLAADPRAPDRRRGA